MNEHRIAQWLRLGVVALCLGPIASAQAGTPDATSDTPSEVRTLTIQEAMMWWTRSGDRSFVAADGESVHMSADVTLAHPTFFEAGGETVPAGIADGTEIVFFLTENIHYGDLPDEVTAFKLYVDDLGPFEPVAVELVNPDFHHRVHRLVFRAPPASDGTLPILVDEKTVSLALSAVGGTRPLVLAWNLHDDYDGAPPLNLSSAEIVRVQATADGFAPSVVELTVGQSVIIVFENPTDQEHHFHVNGLPIGDTLRWLVSVEGRDFSDDALRAAAQFDSHICDSEFGYCPTGAWVHLHANPGGEDAIAFIPQEAGVFSVSCPIHPTFGADVVVKPGSHQHH
jgi:plastocyanin